MLGLAILFLSLSLPTQASGPADAEITFKRAQRLVDTGQVEPAVRLLRRLIEQQPGASRVPRVRYLLGRSLIKIGRYEEAARLFEQLAETYPELRSDHIFYRGLALYRWGSYLDAAAAFERIEPGGPHMAEATRLRAWALLKATDYRAVVSWLSSKEPLADPELALVLSQAKHRIGDVLGAYRGLHKVWREAERPDLIGQALVHMAKLKIGARRMIPAKASAAVLGLSGRLLNGKLIDDALFRLERIPPGELRAEVIYARGRIARRRGKTRTALGHFQRAAAAAPKKRALAALSTIASGALLERLGRIAEALAIYLDVSHRFAQRPAAEEALYRASRLLLDGRKYGEASDRCEALLLTNPVTRFRRACLWNMGWGQFRLGKYVRARQFFSSLIRMKPSADQALAATYWLARAEAQSGAAKTASKRFKSILAEHPLSYYSALAEAQLTEVLKEPSLGQPKRSEEGKVPPQIERIREYLKLGLKRQALAALSKFEHTQPERLSAQALKAMAQLYQSLRRSADARRVRELAARRYPTAVGDAAFIEQAKRAHPLKFEEPIRAAAERFELPTSLLFALIRTESGFVPSAVSAMDAYGLAQLILPTARRVSRRIGAGRVSKWRLLNRPSVNVTLGAAYLRELLDHYEGSEVLALAAYNAGPGAVDAWARRRVRKLGAVQGRGLGLMPSPDELAEEIPVDETRRFVKAVLARARGYARLYQKPTVKESLAAPEEIGAYTEPEEPPKPLRRGSMIAEGIRVVESSGARPIEGLDALYAPNPLP